MVSAEWFSELNEVAEKIRTKVFIEEQKFRYEFDDIDDDAIHLLLYSDGEPAGYGRCYKDSEDMWHIGRIAVLHEFRGRHYGEKILDLLEDKIRQSGGKSIILSAQCRARGFYEKSGYSAVGSEYLDEYCPHINMIKNL